jgi:2',3'-cyclic-nucleotide 2'-phosphodiesterase (5'-nucleotidase family)
MKSKKFTANILCCAFVFLLVGCRATPVEHITTDEFEIVRYEHEGAYVEEVPGEEIPGEDATVESVYSEDIDLSAFNQFHLTILHTNDWHGVLHNVPKYATLVREIRAETENVLLLDGGDLYRRGSFEEFHGAVEVAIMNVMGYDAIAFGNNDFPLNDDELFNVSEHTIIQLADFPILCANVTIDGDFVEGFDPFTVVTKQDIDIAIIGVTSPKPWDRNFDFTTRYLFECPLIVVEELTQEVGEISDIQIVLSHAGFEFERQMHWVSAVIGGDDHLIFFTPYVISHEDRRVPVVQVGGERNHVIGRLDLHFLEVDDEWILHDFSGRILSAHDVIPCPEILEIIDSFSVVEQ